MPSALILAAFVIVAIIFIAGSNWYVAFLTVHILFAVAWVGGGLMLTVLALRAELSDDPMETVTVVRQAAAVGERYFTPLALVVLLSGIAMMLTDRGSVWEWGSFWILFGLLGFAATFVVGIGLLAPQAKQLRGLMETAGPTAPETQAAISKIILISRVDIAILLLVVVDMTAKPFL
jgi:hypothetical protein